MSYKLFDYLSKDGFYLTQGYGINPSTYKPFGLLYHEGLDFGHKNKTQEIKALHQGVVLQDWDEPKGNYGDHLVIWDDEQKCASWYCHLSENSVSIGDRVKAGQVIGRMGKTGNVTGPHLHLNFVQTDAKGNRLYNTKESNLGFLDPQHPQDPNPPKFPPGVTQYGVEWTLPQDNIPVEPAEIQQLKQRIADLEKEVEERKEREKNLEIEKKASNDKYTRDIQFLADKLLTTDNVDVIGVAIDKLIVAEDGLRKCVDEKRKCGERSEEISAEYYKTLEELSLASGISVASSAGVKRALAAYLKLHPREIVGDIKDFSFIIKLGGFIWRK